RKWLPRAYGTHHNAASTARNDKNPTQILYRTMGCKPRADLYPSPCLSRREDP
ncbi:unnamed protein product, partial [Ascophyllum nodosum]